MFVFYISFTRASMLIIPIQIIGILNMLLVRLKDKNY